MNSVGHIIYNIAYFDVYDYILYFVGQGIVIKRLGGYCSPTASQVFGLKNRMKNFTVYLFII